MQFKSFKSDKDILSDKVVAAMETGNPSRAREVLAEHREAFPAECNQIRREVQADYGIRL